MDVDPAKAGVDEGEVAEIGQADAPEAVEFNQLLNVNVAVRVYP